MKIKIFNYQLEIKKIRESHKSKIEKRKKLYQRRIELKQCIQCGSSDVLLRMRKGKIEAYRRCEKHRIRSNEIRNNSNNKLFNQKKINE